MSTKNHRTVRRSLKLEIPAAYTFLQVIGPCIASILDETPLTNKETAAYNIELAIHEACTNIIEHAYAGDESGQIQMTLSLCVAPTELVVELFDNGRSFDLLSVPKPNPEEPQIRGYGLFLIHQLMDHVEYNTQADGNAWQMVKKLE